jgi:putative tryptophan/tyrosine transport system substrate-binding protein
MLARPRPGFAQTTDRVYRVGWLDSTGTRNEPYQIAFVQRLRELGFAEGRNLVIDFRTTEGRIERLPVRAADLARQKCDVLFVPGTEAGLVAMKRENRDTPIVMVANDYDPVATGHVASLARPGGRITGVSQIQSEMPAKRLELLKEVLPKARRVTVFSAASSAGQLRAVQAAALRLGVALYAIEFSRAPYDYDGAYAASVLAKAKALLVLVSGNFVPARRRIPELALKHRLPSMFGNALWADAGGLMSYGPNFSEIFRRAAEHVGTILKGANPADMPVEQPTAFELAINLKTARALGVPMPQSILVRADRVIQ